MPSAADRSRNAAEIFADALEIAPPEERAAFLDGACAGDSALRAEVESLLARREAANAFFRTPLVAGKPFETGVAADAALGREVGSYRLVSLIASGGMGSVYLGERIDREFTKRVAIKLIRAGMGTEAILARFRTERQVLADLEHPNIARLLDGGSTPDGLPYLVMEFVDGMPIDRFADAHRLTIAQRLRLFLEVCDAVHFAHRHLVIHRDVKPSNILVDASGRPKLLDFGIAKVLDSSRTAAAPEPVATLVRALTPSYASPEQFRGGRVTTSTDVYSLGVVLYELLTGVLPHEFEGRSAAETERLVCEAAPERPARAVRSAATTAERGERRSHEIAALRRTTPQRLARLLSGDLEVVVLKALKKEPERRYRSAGDLMEDIRRHLDSEPVLARPDSAAYRFSRFVRRHKAAAAGLTAFVALLLAFAITAAIQSRRIALERDSATVAAAQAEAVTRFLQEMLGSVDPTRANARPHDVSVREIFEEAERRLDADSLANQPLVEAAVRSTLAKSYLGLGLYDAAESHARRTLELRRRALAASDPEVASALEDLARVRHEQGAYTDGAALLREALAIRRSAADQRGATIARNLHALAAILADQRELAAAESLHREAAAEYRAAPDSAPREAAWNLIELARVLIEKGDLAGASPLLEEGVEILRAGLGDDHPDVGSALINLGRARNRAGDLAGAEEANRAALAIFRRAHGENHDDVATALNNLAYVLHRRGDFAGAEPLYREAVAIWRRTLGDEHPDVATGLGNLGRVLLGGGDLAGAEELFEEALARRRDALGEDHPDVAYSLYDLAVLRMDAADTRDAERLLREALAIQDRKLAARDAERGRVITALGRCLLERGERDAAERLLQEGSSILAEKQPAYWQRFEAMSLLGAALAGRGEFVQAESLLLAGHAALEADASTPRLRRVQAHGRVVSLYRRWGKPEIAAAWLERAPSEGSR